MSDNAFRCDLDAALENNPQPSLKVEDIDIVDAAWTDGRSEPEFVWLLKLKDARWATAWGGCDYTGWDCSSDLESSIHPNREEAIRFGLTTNQRENLGLLLHDDSARITAPSPEPKEGEP